MQSRGLWQLNMIIILYVYKCSTSWSNSWNRMALNLFIYIFFWFWFNSYIFYIFGSEFRDTLLQTSSFHQLIWHSYETTVHSIASSKYGTLLLKVLVMVVYMGIWHHLEFTSTILSQARNGREITQSELKYKWKEIKTDIYVCVV